MNISNGISQISSSNINNSNVIKKTYLWPIYNAGKVEKVDAISRRTENNPIYVKPSPEEKEKILSLSQDYTESEYNSKGIINNKLAIIKPGSLFDSFA